VAFTDKPIVIEPLIEPLTGSGWFKDDTLQENILRVGSDVFGVENATDKRERLLRFAEESIELLRAGGLTWDDIAKIVYFEFNRPVGTKLSQEFGGAAITLFAAANAHGYELLMLAESEIKRVGENKTKHRAKHAAKPDMVVAVRATP
jgi:hypothetical protein